MVDPTDQNITAAVAAAQAADVVILALGINSEVAQEGQDRGNISLPGAQSALAQAVLAVGKPTVVVLITGAQLGIDDIVSASKPQLAIVNAGAPGGRRGQGALAQHALASHLWQLPVSVVRGTCSRLQATRAARPSSISCTGAATGGASCRTRCT